MPRSLVTGGAGFIGSHLVDMLVDTGHEVIVIDNESADNEVFYWNQGAKNYKLDICDYNSIRPLFDGVDYVFHLAAESRLPKAIENPIEATHKNVTGTCTVLQCAKEANVKRLVYSSTSSIYGLNEGECKEDSPRDCLNPYSVTKAAGEDLCAMYTRMYGLETIILRYFSVYGERMPAFGQYALVLGIFMKQFKNKQSLTVTGDGGQIRDFVYVKDLALANIFAATSKVSPEYYGTIFNIAGGKGMSILELAQSISNDYVFIPKREGETRVNLANTDKAKSVLGWKPKIDVKEWIKGQL